jgi:3-hydroxyisobutyrate dehydrogenase
MRRIALLGVGIMGAGLAETWLKKGFAVAVYNRTRDKAAALAASGACVAATPAEAAAGAELIVAIVADEAASRAVWLGETGALAAAEPGAVIVESSTVPPEWARELAQRAGERGLQFLDAPVAGSKAAAASGALTLLVGGDAGALERARPGLEAISRQIVHLGPTGAGATWKLIHNMMLAVHVAAAAEAIALAAKAGFDRAQVLSLIDNGPAASFMVKFKMPRFTEQRFDDADFALRHMIKDARYALALGEKYGARLDVVRGATADYERADKMGFGDLDFAGVLKAMLD